MNIIPADLNFDGLLDFLVFTNTTSIYNFINQQCSVQQCELAPASFIPVTLPNLQNIIGQPFVADINGDQKVELIFYANNNRYYWQFDQTGNVLNNQAILLSTLTDQSPGSINQMVVQFTDPHFNQIIDMNGDCIADLVITSLNSNKQKQIEIWLNNGNNIFKLQNVIQTQIQDYTFVTLGLTDINFDGGVDIITVYSNNAINKTYFGIQYSTVSLSQDELCTQKNVNFNNFNTLQNTSYLPFPQDLTIFVDPSQIQYLTPMIRFGDFDNNGYPDLLLTLQYYNSQQTFSMLLFTQDCGSKCVQFIPGTQYDQADGKGQFSYFQQKTINAVRTSFFDLNENGKLDFFVLLKSTPGSNSSNLYVNAYYNYLTYDTFFLKQTATNGQSQDKGGNYYGATFQCVITTQDTDYKVGQGNQLSMSAYNSLQLPFVILGLTRTNNYIENLNLGMQYQDCSSSCTQQWTPIIPNSQLQIYPQGKKPSDWNITIFIKPTEAIVIVIIVTVSILIILGGLIIYYHMKEKEEDRKTEDQFIQIFR